MARHRVSERYRWEFNGVPIEGIVEYVGAKGIIASRWGHLRCKEIRQGDWVDLREWKDANGYHGEGYTYYGDFGRVDSTDWIGEGWVHIILNAGSCYLDAMSDWSGGWVSISGGPFQAFHPDDLIPTGELKAGRYWNFRMDYAEGDNGQDYIIERPVFKLVPNPRSWREVLDRREEEFENGTTE